MLALLVALLFQLTPDAKTHRVQLLENGDQTPLVIDLPRDQYLNLYVSISAPTGDSEVEELLIRADNQQAGYWKGRRAPNLTITESLKSGESSLPPLRIVHSGAGQSSGEHYASISVELRERKDIREKRARDFVATAMAGQKEQIPGAAAYFENYYVANRIGTHDLTIEYRPASGVFARKTLSRKLEVRVAPGPDSLDRMK